MLEYHTKQKIMTQHEKSSISNTKDKILQDINSSIARKETLIDNLNNAELPRDEDL